MYGVADALYLIPLARRQALLNCKYGGNNFTTLLHEVSQILPEGLLKEMITSEAQQLRDGWNESVNTGP